MRLSTDTHCIYCKLVSVFLLSFNSPPLEGCRGGFSKPRTHPGLRLPAGRQGHPSASGQKSLKGVITSEGNPRIRDSSPAKAGFGMTVFLTLNNKTMSKQSTPPIVRPDKKYFLSFSKRQVVIFVLVFGVISGGAILYKTLLTRGANYGWLQTDWSGGASTTAVARHPGDIDTWTKYSSKDPLLSTSTDGQLTLSSQTASTTDTATADFNAGTASNVYVENGTVKLKKPNGVACTAGTECTAGYCVNSTCNTLAVGDTYQGGKVFYLSGGHGLIAMTSDTSASAQWGCYATTITGADSNTNGAQNTIDIVAGCSTSGIPARLCSDLSSGGYSDWYLPAKDQLNTLYTQRATVGGFTTSVYWSSTEFSSIDAWSQGFDNGGQYNSDKFYAALHVRCIRSF